MRGRSFRRMVSLLRCPLNLVLYRSPMTFTVLEYVHFRTDESHYMNDFWVLSEQQMYAGGKPARVTIWKTNLQEFLSKDETKEVKNLLSRLSRFSLKSCQLVFQELRSFVPMHRPAVSKCIILICTSWVLYIHYYRGFKPKPGGTLDYNIIVAPNLH